MFYSYNEIFSQGETLKKTMEYVLGKTDEIKAFFLEADFDEVVFIACGSSYWASMSACMTLQEEIQKPCSMIKSGDIVMNPGFYRKKYKKPIVIAPSRSGSTSETMIALKLFREVYNSKVLSLVEYENSPILEVSDLTLFIPWANETSVCQTRSFSNLYLSMVTMSAVLGEDTLLIRDLEKYLGSFEVHSGKAETLIQKAIEEFGEWESLVALGNGKQYGVVVEGAYINIEMAQLPAHYFATLEWRHGPIVISDSKYLVAITTGDPNANKYEENMARETRQTGAKVLSITAEDTFKNADYRLYLGWEACPETVALYSVMILQGIAYYQAIHRETDPDKPGDLSPWIAI